MASKVYFTDFRAATGHSPIDKLHKLILAAGIGKLDVKDKFVAVKTHFGEPGNTTFPRPYYVDVVVRELQKMGGTVFLTDANTLYSGGRSNAVNHLDTAMRHGFNPIQVSAPVIIADGLNGTDCVDMPVVGGQYCDTAKIGMAIAKADVIVTVSHFKGHEMSGFGGCLKNIGMGCASRAGKMLLHADSKPVIDKNNCTGCGVCQKSCAHNAVHVGKDHLAVIDYDKCLGCGQCIAVCQHSGSVSAQDSDSARMNCKIAEYSKAVVDGKQNFHVTLIMDVSPECDCWSGNDAAIVPNIGMCASFDPVALDQACADLVMKAPALPNTMYSDNYEKSKAELPVHGHNCQGEHDHFYFVHPDTDWKSGLVHGQKIGLGTMDYELVTVK